MHCRRHDRRFAEIADIGRWLYFVVVPMGEMAAVLQGADIDRNKVKGRRRMWPNPRNPARRDRATRRVK